MAFDASSARNLTFHDEGGFEALGIIADLNSNHALAPAFEAALLLCRSKYACCDGVLPEIKRLWRTYSEGQAWWRQVEGPLEWRCNALDTLSWTLHQSVQALVGAAHDTPATLDQALAAMSVMEANHPWWNPDLRVEIGQLFMAMDRPAEAWTQFSSVAMQEGIQLNERRSAAQAAVTAAQQAVEANPSPEAEARYTEAVGLLESLTPGR